MGCQLTAEWAYAQASLPPSRRTRTAVTLVSHPLPDLEWLALCPRVTLSEDASHMPADRASTGVHSMYLA